MQNLPVWMAVVNHPAGKRRAFWFAGNVQRLALKGPSAASQRARFGNARVRAARARLSSIGLPNVAQSAVAGLALEMCKGQTSDSIRNSRHLHFDRLGDAASRC